MLRTLTTALVCLTATALVACGDSSEGASPTPTGPSEAYTTALAELTVDDLGALVLQQGDYGLMALGMEISDTSGPFDNEEAVDQLEILERSAADLDRLGRLGGYRLNFESPSLDDGQLFALDTWIDLFDESGDPDAYLELLMEDFHAADGVGGMEVLAFEEFEIDGIEGARGWDATLRYPGIESPLAFVWGAVQRGRLLAGADVGLVGEGDRRAELVGLMQELDTRIQDALDGTIEVSVEHVLPATDEDRKVPAPLGGPDFAAMALAPEELGPGWRLDDEGYYADPSHLALFSREYKYVDKGDALIGDSVVAGVEAELTLWLSEEDASSFVASRRALFEGPEGAAFFAEISADEEGRTILDPLTEVVELPLADQTLVLTISGEWPSIGRSSVVLIWIRSSDVVSTLTIEGSVEPPALADLEVIAGLAAERLTATGE